MLAASANDLASDHHRLCRARRAGVSAHALGVFHIRRFGPSLLPSTRRFSLPSATVRMCAESSPGPFLAHELQAHRALLHLLPNDKRPGPRRALSHSSSGCVGRGAGNGSLRRVGRGAHRPRPLPPSRPRSRFGRSSRGCSSPHALEVRSETSRRLTRRWRRLTLRCTGLGAASCCIASALLFRVRLQAGELGSG
jgi:hypothetical protein